MDAFKPDLVLWSSLIAGFAVGWAKSRGVPDISVALQPQTAPSNEFKPIMFQRVPVDPDQPIMSLWLMQAQAEANRYFTTYDWVEGSWKEFGPVDPEKAIAACVEYGCALPEQTFDELFNIEASVLIKLCAFSTSFWAPPKEWPQGGIKPEHGGIEVVGRWLINKDVQGEMAATGNSSFFGNNQVAVDFFKAGEMPVYLGWGSMLVYSKEWMTQLAVRSLKLAGQRGIIVGGWAAVSIDCLDTADDCEELKEYCKDNVLFLQSAPHEWLFPQCRCAVHHGGIGTTQASLGSGCPTIVTPVFADQHDIANRIENVLKVGKRCSQFAKVTAEELGKAIRTCCEDKSIQENARKLADKMAQEDGCARAQQVIERFLNDEYKTGKWKQRITKVHATQLETRLRKKKMKKEAVFSQWNVEVSKKYPAMAEYNAKQIDLMTQMAHLAQKGHLWVVKAGTGALAKKGESIKTEEAGRFTQWTIVEQLDMKKNRLHVKRRKGVGPDEGWVSVTNKGNEVMSQLNDLMGVNMILGMQIQSLFSNLIPKDKANGKKTKNAMNSIASQVMSMPKLK